MALLVPEYIETRIRQYPPQELSIVPSSTPVISFGDLQRANVATLGWNPSKVEFLDHNGTELTGEERRLETLSSLGESNLSSASPESIYKIFQGCNNYFQRRPYHWFNKLEKVLRSLETSYYNGTACHLDFVQWATNPTWGKLNEACKEKLIKSDLLFLHQQLSQKNFQLLLLNGSGIAKAYSELLDCPLTEMVISEKIGLRLFIGRTMGGTKVIGWNKNLQSSFGVSNEYIENVITAIKRLK